MLIPVDMNQGNSGNSILGQSSLIGSSPFVGNSGLSSNLLSKLYNKLIEKGYAKTVFFDKAYERDFRKFNKYLKTSKLIREPSQPSEKSSKQKSDSNR